MEQMCVEPLSNVDKKYDLPVLYAYQPKIEIDHVTGVPL